jgi:hypothetical protein
LADFIDIAVETDPDALKQTLYELIQEQFPEWDPSKASLDKWIVDGTALIGADLGGLTVSVGKELFRQFGLTILAFPPLEAEPATGTVTINVIDTAGYTIPAGYQMTIEESGSNKIAFRTKADAVVTAGQTKVEGVQIEAVVDGTEANDLTEDPKPLDSITFIKTIEQTSVETSGGVDEETPDEYLDRLATELQLLTTTPIIPSDFEKLARQIPGVYRAVAIDMYDSDKSEENKERNVSVAMVDVDGVGANAERKAEYKALAEEKREVNFEVHVMDPTYTEIDVEVEVVTLPGFSPAQVKAAVEEALQNYLDPSNWGNTQENPRLWRQNTTVRQTELIWLMNNVPGVDYVKGTLKLAKHGSTLEGKDVTLTGKAALTKPKTLTVKAVES